MTVANTKCHVVRKMYGHCHYPVDTLNVLADGASGWGFCASGLTVGSTGRAVSRDASTEDLIFSSDMAAGGG